MNGYLTTKTNEEIMSWNIIYRHAKLIIKLYWRRIKRFFGKNELEELEKWYETTYYGQEQPIQQQTQRQTQRDKIPYIEFNKQWTKELLHYMKLIGFMGGLVFGFPIFMLMEESNWWAIPIIITWIGISIHTLHYDRQLEMKNFKDAAIEVKTEQQKKQAIQKWEKEHENNPPKYNFGE